MTFWVLLTGLLIWGKYPSVGTYNPETALIIKEPTEASFLHAQKNGIWV